jgi:hypothetical protein
LSKPEWGADTPPKEAARHPLVVLLSAVVLLEAALLAAATIYLGVEIVVASPASLISAVALAVLVAIAAAWLAAVGVNVLRGSAWVRGAIVVWQLLQLVLALGAFQGLIAQPEWGLPLIGLAIFSLVLVFTPPVVRATSRQRN